MAYNYGPPPGAYRPGQPSYPFAGAAGAPGTMPAQGMEGAPGVHPQMPSNPQAQGFQPPPNMPNINFNAPVIRLGLQDQNSNKSGLSAAADRLIGGQGGGRAEGRGSNAEPLGRNNRLGLGAGGDGRHLDRERAAMRESMMVMHPSTREEVARTIFIGGLSDGAPNDDAIESMLRCAGKLRRWTRARDSDDKLCKFGFAEYEDVDSLEAANEILPGIQVPMIGKDGKLIKDEDDEPKQMNLLVVVDEQSKSYIEEWKGKSREDDNARQFRIEGCKDDLRQCITAITTSAAALAEDANGAPGANVGVDTTMAEADGGNGDGTIVNIPLALEDDLADIPAEMRATVAEEIRAFRDRSNRRDLERLRREEELEAAERNRSSLNLRTNRLTSPAPNGSTNANAANGVPVGPRDRSGMPGAPSGPKGYRGAQLPSDYVNGVKFVGTNGTSNVVEEDEEASESDEELERRRQAKKTAEDQKQYASASNRWLGRERLRKMAQDRERNRKDAEKQDKDHEREKKMRYLREFNDDEEAKKGELEFFRDRSSWLRKRNKYRETEDREDEVDRQAEAREKADERRKTAETRDMAEDFLAQTGAEIQQRAAAAAEASKPGFKISLGSAAARTRAQAAASQAAQRRALNDIENLLEDEDDDVDATLTGGVRARPELRPLTDTSTAPLADASNDMTPEERATTRQAIAATIPAASSDELFSYNVRWNYLTPHLLDTRLRPFVEDKVVEYLGVQEELLVDAVLDGLRDHKAPTDIIAEVEGALEEDAEGLVRKTWRTVIFTTELEARGLN